MIAAAWRVFVDACRAEWTKANTLSSTRCLLALSVIAGVGLSAIVCATVPDQLGGHTDPARLALTGTQLGQAVLAVWAVRAAGGEFRTGMIGMTLLAVPARGSVLAARAAVTAALASIAGLVMVASSLLLAGDRLSSGAPFRVAFGSVLYLALIALLALGTTFAVRDTAAATGIVLALLYLVPLAAQLTGNDTWRRHLEQLGPTTAGLGIQATTDLSTLPIGPWSGLAVLAGWTAASLLLGALALCRRDA